MVIELNNYFSLHQPLVLSVLNYHVSADGGLVLFVLLIKYMLIISIPDKFFFVSFRLRCLSNGYLPVEDVKAGHCMRQLFGFLSMNLLNLLQLLFIKNLLNIK